MFFICKPTREVFEERISSHRQTLQSHKDFYHQNPLAQKLLALQSEKAEIEGHIKTWDDQIMTKQKELEHLTGNKLFYFITLIDLKYSEAFKELIQFVSEQIQ